MTALCEPSFSIIHTEPDRPITSCRKQGLSGAFALHRYEFFLSTCGGTSSSGAAGRRESAASDLHFPSISNPTNKILLKIMSGGEEPT